MPTILSFFPILPSFFCPLSPTSLGIWDTSWKLVLGKPHQPLHPCQMVDVEDKEEMWCLLAEEHGIASPLSPSPYCTSTEHGTGLTG